MDWKATMSKLGRAATQKAATAAKSVADAASERLSKVSDPQPPPVAEDGFHRMVEEAIDETKTSSPPPRAKLVGRKAIQAVKPLPPIPQLSRPAFSADLPRRSWFARTFVAPLERLVGGLAKLVVTAFAIAVTGFVCLVVLVRFMPASPVTPSMPTQQPIASSTTTITPRAAEPIRRESPNRASPPRSESHTKSPAKSSGAHKESLRERAYESLTGKEVVHRKDGSTFERKQPNKK